MKPVDYPIKTELEILAQTFEQSVQSKKASLLEKDYLSLSYHYEKEFSLPKSLEVINCGLRFHKFSPSLHTKKAKLLLLLEENELALESLDRAEMFGQPFVETDCLRAEAYIALNDYDNAFDILQNLRLQYVISDEVKANSLVLEAKIYQNQGLYIQMYETLKEALECCPSHVQALEAMWVAMESSKQYEDAIDLHHRLLEQDAYQALTWFNLGHALFRVYDYEGAMEAFDFAILNDEKFKAAYSDYIEIAIQQKQYFLAIACLKKAKKNFELDEDFLIQLGKCYLEIKGYDKARISLFQALRIDNYNPEIYHLIGKSYIGQRRFSDAHYYLKKAVSLEEENEEYHVTLALTSIYLEKYDEVQKHFDCAIDIAPHLSSTWGEYAQFLLQFKNESAALTLLNEAEEFTYGAELYYLKAACLLRMEKISQCLKNLEEGLIEDYNLKNLFLKNISTDDEEHPRIKAIFRYYGLA